MNSTVTSYFYCILQSKKTLFCGKYSLKSMHILQSEETADVFLKYLTPKLGTSYSEEIWYILTQIQSSEILKFRITPFHALHVPLQTWYSLVQPCCVRMKRSMLHSLQSLPAMPGRQLHCPVSSWHSSLTLP